MVANITFFPVGNGDMTLIRLASGKAILIDMNIRAAADDPDDSTRDVAKDLRERLNRDDKKRLYVDAFVLTHPDKDHCTGLSRHFHLWSLDEYKETDDKIVIREIWSSPVIFRRAKKDSPLCDDAKAFRTEVKRRVSLYRSRRETGTSVGDGDRIKILGRDEAGKTDDLTAILVEVDGLISKVNGEEDSGIEARLLAPLPLSEDKVEEELLSKNNSSVILRIKLMADGGTAHFLVGGDAEVAIWERQWARHKSHPDWLHYDLLLAPHHCSWHSLSYDSWSDLGEKARVSQDARNALGQALAGAHVVACSKPIADDDSDPPCVRAKREYESILKGVSGQFLCVADHPSSDAPEPLEFELAREGLSIRGATKSRRATAGSAPSGLKPSIAPAIITNPSQPWISK